MDSLLYSIKSMSYDFLEMMAQNMLLMHGKPSTFIPYWRITMIKKSLISAAVAASLFALSSAASAAPMSNWFIDTDGIGGNAPVMVQNYLDLVGTAFVQNSFTSGTTFSFNEAGLFTTSTADGGSLLGGANLSPALTASFLATGTGTTGGALTFTPGGTLKVYSGAIDIADFSLLSGSAGLYQNSTLPNGTVSLILKATNMLSGYFFNSSMQDLAGVVSTPEGLVLGMATTNVTNYNSAVPTPLINAYNTGFGTSLPSATGNGSTTLLLSNNGQFAMEVPEPSMLSLLGLALVGVGFTTRRKSKV